MIRWLAFGLALALASSASAQNAVTQNGTVVPGDVMQWARDRTAQDPGGLTGRTADGLGLNPFSITDNNGLALCANSAATTGPFHALCFGHTGNGDGVLSSSGGGSFTIEINGVPIAIPGSISGLPTVLDNATLMATPRSFATLLIRQDFAAGLGAPPTFYYASTSPCPLNAGVGDGGSQIKTSDGGCWLLAKGQRLVPEIWGAAGTGTDDGPEINAATAYISSIGGGKLYGSNGRNYSTASTITVPANTCIVGAGFDNSKITALSNFTPVVSLGNASCLRDIRVDATLQTTGVVIQMGTTNANFRASLSGVYTQKGCIALDVNGGSHTVRDSFFYEMTANPACGGIRVGHATTGGTTSDLSISGSTTACLPGSVAGFGLLVEDSGGMFLGPGVDQVVCTYGMVIKPQANQIVAYTYCNASAIGDTNGLAGLLIDTGAANAKVMGNTFTECWTSAAQDPTNGTGIQIQNTGGGTISGLNFIGHRAYSNFKFGVHMLTPAAGVVAETNFNGLRVCGIQTSGVDIQMEANTGATIQNSRIGKDCDNQTAGTVNPAFGVALAGNNEVFLTGNDVGGLATPISGLPVGNSVIADNKGSSNLSGPTYASGGIVTLTLVTPRIHLTGTTAVSTITPAWNGQPLCIISNDGAVAFNTAGNIANAVTTSGINGQVCGYFDPTFSKWFLH